APGRSVSCHGRPFAPLATSDLAARDPEDREVVAGRRGGVTPRLSRTDLTDCFGGDRDGSRKERCADRWRAAAAASRGRADRALHPAASTHGGAGLPDEWGGGCEPGAYRG